MNFEFLPQLGLGFGASRRTGDKINEAINDPNTTRFKFAVAYMRLSGWQRIATSINSLIARNGEVLGAVGVDQGITSIEALEALKQLSPRSTVYHTISSLIFHPKLYVASGKNQASVFIGSPNLTRDGLFRNIEVAGILHLDMKDNNDVGVFQLVEKVLDAFLDTSNPNVKRISPKIIRILEKKGLIKSEGLTSESTLIAASRQGASASSAILRSLFPPLQVQLPPPLLTVGGPSFRRATKKARSRAPVTFVMQLSSFDSSHRTGVPGTAEVLIPHGAVSFFPALSQGREAFPSTYFDVNVNTTIGSFKSRFRLWYYETRATGSRIDEYRLRMDRATIDLSNPGGGDLLVVSKLPAASMTPYEVTVLSARHPDYQTFLAKCTQTSGTKIWGFA